MRSRHKFRLVKKNNRYEEKECYNNYFHNDYKYGPKTNSRNGYTWSKNKTDDLLSVCTVCNTVWEIEVNSNRIAYYDDFPTIGKQRKDCPKCKNQSH